MPKARGGGRSRSASADASDAVARPMPRRERLEGRVAAGGSYFPDYVPPTFIPTGSKLLDLAMGGGWAESRVGNIVGDRSTGKTLLCIEACANFHRKHPDGRIYYRESERAFDIPYARTLGLPEDAVDFGAHPLDTVEDMFEDLCTITAQQDVPTLYICDSLDALSDRDEQKRSMDQGSYGAQKAKNMSELFRRLARAIEASRTTMIVVSQIRDTMARFGRKVTRSGGHALDFYCTHVLWLMHMGIIKRSVGSIERPVGVTIKVRVDKNKVANPYREVEFPIVFGYGVQDVISCLHFLKAIGKLNEIGVPEAKINATAYRLMAQRDPAFEARLHGLVEQHWNRIEDTFLPKGGGKYA